MTIIATWEMSFEGVKIAQKLLKENKSYEDAICALINDVELNPEFHTVGYSGYPNEICEVELDAAIINGDNLHFGAVAAMKHIKTPIDVARLLMDSEYSNFISGDGALKFALENGFKKQNLLTGEAKAKYDAEIANKEKTDKGHDTIGAIIAGNGRVVSATSTSGLFLKHEGRIGDSPLVGAGLYADSKVGGATATGVGEDIIKGVLSFQVVNLMKSGLSAQEAATKAVEEFDANLKDRGETPRDFSIVCLDKYGNWGAASNISEFPFVVSDGEETKLYVSKNYGKIIEEK